MLDEGAKLEKLTKKEKEMIITIEKVYEQPKYRTKNVGSREKEKNWVEKD
jgi:hypothetical protein